MTPGRARTSTRVREEIQYRSKGMDRGRSKSQVPALPSTRNETRDSFSNISESHFIYLQSRDTILERWISCMVLPALSLTPGGWNVSPCTLGT